MQMDLNILEVAGLRNWDSSNPAKILTYIFPPFFKKIREFVGWKSKKGLNKRQKKEKMEVILVKVWKLF